jgi:glycosyltransferase EpsD
VSSGYHADDFLLFNAGEFNKNKNQKFLLHSMVPIIKEIPHARLLLAGEGVLLESCKRLAEQLGISDHVTFLGFQNNIDEIMPMCDVAIAASLREGLPVNIMEAMSCGLPVVAVDNRGHRELVHNGANGWLMEEWDAVQFANKVKSLVQDDLGNMFGRNGRELMIRKYSTNQILKEKSKMYQTYMDEGEDVSWMIH